MTTDISKIIDACPDERIMRVGTDIVADLGGDEALAAMLDDDNASFEHEYGAIYYTSPDEPSYRDHPNPTIKAIVEHASKQGYAYVWFDCDIETRFRD